MKTKSGLKIESITIIGRRWFQRTYGNTYHTCVVLVNGQQVYEAPQEYGYGDQYVETGARWLEKFGYMNRKKYDNGGHEPVRIWAERNGIAFDYRASDVARERDL